MRNLTPKQQAFTDAIIAGSNPTAAYRAAYNCENMSASSVNREALRLVNHPMITPLIEAARRKASETALWSRQTAIERLAAINSVSYTHMMKNGYTDRESAGAFFQSLDRLNELTGDGDTPESAATLRKVPVMVFSESYMIEHYNGAVYVETVGNTTVSREEFERRNLETVAARIDVPVLCFDRRENDDD